MDKTMSEVCEDSKKLLEEHLNAVSDIIVKVFLDGFKYGGDMALDLFKNTKEQNESKSKD